jgi:FtsH-binding integral membrane protein
VRPAASFGQSRAFAAADTAAVNDFLWKTYRWMSFGLALTGLVAWVVANTPAVSNVIFTNPMLFYGLLIGEVVMVIAFTRMVSRLSFAQAAAMFLAYSAVNGLTLSFIFLIYTQGSVAQVFFITAGTFAGLSFFGATTKRDLSPMGRFLVFGLIGFLIASVVNIFLASGPLYWIITYAGVAIFAGLTAYDTQKLKNIYAAQGEGGNLALRGALILYLDFVNLMLLLLRILGRRR